jgi:hypothetical protein
VEGRRDPRANRDVIQVDVPNGGPALVERGVEVIVAGIGPSGGGGEQAEGTENQSQ